MSMIINFFAIPDKFTTAAEENKISIIELAKYVQKAYKIEDEDSNTDNKSIPCQFKEPLEFYYYPTFSIFEKLYELTFNVDEKVPIIGFQPFTDEEAEILLNEYVGYSGGFLTFKNIQELNNIFSNLSYEDFLEKVFGNNNSRKQAICSSIKKELGFSEEDILEELPYLKEYYNEFSAYLGKIIECESKQKLGLFISID